METYPLPWEELWLGESGFSSQHTLLLKAESLCYVKGEFLFTEGLGDAWAGIKLAVEENHGKHLGWLKNASHII
jgi:hypothetical protein